MHAVGLDHDETTLVLGPAGGKRHRCAHCINERGWRRRADTWVAGQLTMALHCVLPACICSCPPSSHASCAPLTGHRHARQRCGGGRLGRQQGRKGGVRRPPRGRGGRGCLERGGGVAVHFTRQVTSGNGSGGGSGLYSDGQCHHVCCIYASPTFPGHGSSRPVARSPAANPARRPRERSAARSILAIACWYLPN